jgi:hypothetical protein
LTEFDVVFNSVIIGQRSSEFFWGFDFFRIKCFGLLFLENSCPLIQNVFYFAHLTKGGVNIMLIIPIKEGENIDRALKL